MKIGRILFVCFILRKFRNLEEYIEIVIKKRVKSASDKIFLLCHPLVLLPPFWRWQQPLEKKTRSSRVQFIFQFTLSYVSVRWQSLEGVSTHFLVSLGCYVYWNHFISRRVDLDDLHPGDGPPARVPRGAPQPLPGHVPALTPGDHPQPAHWPLRGRLRQVNRQGQKKRQLRKIVLLCRTQRGDIALFGGHPVYILKMIANFRDTYSLQSQRKMCGASNQAVELLPAQSGTSSIYPHYLFFLRGSFTNDIFPPLFSN